MIKKINSFAILIVLSLSLFPLKALAFCPICVVSTGFLAGLFRWLGVDDSILGIWLGAFATSLAIILNNYLLKKQKRFVFQSFLILFGFYLLTILGLYWTGDLTFGNSIFGVNKIIFGIIAGNILLFFSPLLDKFLRKQNQGKIFVSHQKVIIAVGILLTFSLIFYLITK